MASLPANNPVSEGGHVTFQLQPQLVTRQWLTF